MLKPSQVEKQLADIGCRFNFWWRPEVRELAKILMDGEVIARCANGRYHGGMALLCVTNHRLLLVDRKLLSFTLEDIRFDMIAEMDYTAHFMSSTLHIMTPNRRLSFNSWNQPRLRALLHDTQQRVMEVRQHYTQLPYRPEPHPRTLSYAGGVAMQGSRGHHLGSINPYVKLPMVMNQRRAPRFF